MASSESFVEVADVSLQGARVLDLLNDQFVKLNHENGRLKDSLAFLLELRLHKYVFALFESELWNVRFDEVLKDAEAACVFFFQEITWLSTLLFLCLGNLSVFLSP
jgi:hypothetical protein